MLFPTVMQAMQALMRMHGQPIQGLTVHVTLSGMSEKAFHDLREGNSGA